MKKILFLFLAACFFFSCEKETIVIPQQHAGRTVLAFFWADNSLNFSLRDNIQTMMQGLQAMKDSAALLVYWDGEASDISWPEPCIVEYVTNGQGGINSLSKGTIDAMMADKNTSIYDLIGIGNIRKKYPPQTSTEKTVMQTVIGDMMSVYPSESYGIIYNPQIQISAESETKRSIFREKDKTKRSKKESAQHSKSRNKSFVMTSVSAL